MKKRKSLMIIVLLLLVGVSTAYVAGTYAKYTSTVNASGTVTVAKWAFASDNNISTINVNLDQTYHATSLVNGRIAPGTSGSFAIALKNTNSEVAANFDVILGTMTDKPTNLKFYKDSSYTQELVLGDATDGVISGQLAAGDSTGLTVNVYWRWLYETGSGSTLVTNDGYDTDDGVAGAALTLPVTIKGTQKPLSTSAITSQINP